jgi:hypothetical protein
VLKICKRCGVEKSKIEFSRDSQKSDGLRSYCKSCISVSAKLYTAKHKDQQRQYAAKWREDNRELLRLKYRKNYNREAERERKKQQRSNPEFRAKLNCYLKGWRLRNPDKLKESYKKQYPLRKKRLKLATPVWLTDDQKNEIRTIYKQCRTMTEFHEMQFHVDHIEPLRGKASCGLHVPWNLQIIPAEENLKKNNKLT